MSTVPTPNPIRWDAEAVKQAVLPHVRSLVKEWGVKLTGEETQKGFLECHAIDREDANPSAAINVANGVYTDRGGSGNSLSIFQLGVVLKIYRDFPSAVNELGERYGVPGIGLKVFDPPVSQKSGKPKNKAAHVVATYDYVDGVGEIIYQVQRKSDKSFAQRRPDGQGGLIHNIDGVQRLPYHLDELVAAPSDATFWIAEGEKDVDRLRSLGLTATCNSGGAGNWADELSPRFRGRRVVILPDNDEKGRKHAEAVAKSLKDHAADIRVIDLAKLARRLRLGILKEKGDVSDLLDMGLALDQLAEAATTAPNPFVREYATLADAHKVIGDTKWFWPGWIPAGNLSLIAAVAGAGKTRLAADICRIIYLGLPTMPDGSPNPHPVGTRSLWLMYDRNWSMTADVIEKYGLPRESVLLPGPKDDPLFLPDWDDPRTFDDLRQQVEQQKPGLIVIDTITYATTKNTSKAEEAKIAFDAVIQVAADTGVPTLGMAHLNKEGSVLNRRIVERARSVILLSTPDPEGQPNRRKLWVDKSAVLKPAPLGITYGETGNLYDDHPPEPVEVEQKKRGPAPAKSTKSAEWLWDQLSVGPTKVKTLVDAAQADGIIAKPTVEKPKPSISPLYNAKDRIPAVKPGWSVDELEIDNRKVWRLIGPTKPDDDSSPEPDPGP